MSDPASASVKEAAWIELFRGRLCLYTVLLNFGILFFGIDSFVVNTLMPEIVADIGGVAYYAWATMLYVVGAIVGSAAYGPMRGRVGGRKALALAGATFCIGALGCSLAPTMPTFLAARLIQGLGGGGMVAGSMAFVAALYAPRLRTRAIAFTSVTWIGSALLGPIIGGIFGEIGWWQGAYWLYVPFGAAFLAGVWWRIPKSADPPSASAPRRFPIWRLALLGLGVMCVGSAGHVGSNLARAALIGAAIAIVWTAFRRDATAENRLFPSKPLSLNGQVGLGYWGLILVTGPYVAVSIYLPLVLAVLHHIPPLYVGAVNAMMSIGWSIAAAVVVGIRGGRERWLMTTGPLIILVGCVGLAGVTSLGGHLAVVAALAVLCGLGIGMFYVHMTAKIMAAALKGEESITASSLSTIRSLGQAFGSALGGTVANVAGLASVATMETVAPAVTSVYLANTLPLALAAMVVWRYFRFQPAQPVLQPAGE